MPLMKVRKEDDTGWYTVDHLNFNYIGLGINEPITLVSKENKDDNNRINKIYVYDGKNDYPYDGNAKEEIMYKSSTEKLLVDGWMPKYNEIFTEMTTVQQKNQAEDIVNNKFNNDNTIKDKNLAKKTFLLEHRTLTDKNETFHILHYWNDSKWIPLNNIWG